MKYTTFIVSEGVFSETTPEGYIVMSPTGQMYRFNGIGEYILMKCDGRHALDKIVAMILNDFRDSSSDTVWSDVRKFIGFLAERGLIQEIELTEESIP